MASRRVEDTHITGINRILSVSGLECIRSPPISMASSSDSGELEEIGPTVEEQRLPTEESPPEEESVVTVEDFFEEEKEVFPTPSLRHMFSDKIRKIEEQNRIHVLPENFKTTIDPAAIPKIAVTAQQKYIDVIAELVGCTRYKSSLAEFWFLDTMANLLRRAQDDMLDREVQAVLMLWFCEWMKEIQQFDAADRQRMLRRFRDNMLSAARFIAEDQRLPNPEEAGVRYKALDEAEVQKITTPKDSKHLVTFKATAYECALRDLMKIMHYIFDLFSTDYQFDLVRSIFTYTPEYQLIDAPFQLQNPKRLYAPLKFKPKKEKPVKKDAKAVKGGKKKDVDTEEYLALMELKAKEERDLDELEELEREEWNRKSHILPLGFAATDELFDKYWPPPPPEPPPPEPEQKPKKGKGKK
ncbi:uncharacterized protein [Choristoneura fumiferana]|uniref:uncharacterized protein n=1 Tax=Choristoneura fumiferana TaxID=7141 RepID=UPI003D156C7C